MKSFIPFLVCWLLASVQIFAQQVWPGDVNDDGIVNNVDVIYWANAKDAVGPPRADADSSWVAQELPDSTLWSEYFIDSLNYAYADCNGDGVVDGLDSSIIRKHYWLRRDSVDYLDEDGVYGEDPLLSLVSEDSLAESSIEKVLNLSVGNSSLTLDSLVGLAFTLRFSPDSIKDVGENQGFDFEYLLNGWINESGNGEADHFIFVDRSKGILQAAIYRKFSEYPASGYGTFASFGIVIEEVVWFKVELELDSAHYFKHNLTAHPLACEGIALLNADSLNTQQGQNEDSEPLDNVLDYNHSLNLYPNPSSGFIQMEMEAQEGEEQQIEGVQVYSIEGMEMLEMEMEEPTNETQLQMNEYEPGLYLIKVRTQDGYIIKKIILSPDETLPGQF